ncbi:MAG TPA: phenylalanine--tRNA ligase subunit beta [Candidatus Limnocylindrales bacterium]|nr:phenylalanine--tRNA ligase subunit beta [Candidatus Limnocylindrales bacterium]
MKISLNSIRGLNKRYGCAGDIAPLGIDDLTIKMGAQLGAVEQVTDIGKKYQGAVLVKVLKCWSHPDSDHLHVCSIDDGGITPDVNRGADGTVEVVCGARNVREGLTAVWLPPGVTVPQSLDKEPFVLEARAIRGVVSNGMLASAKELALGDNHEGILEIDGSIKPGTLFADAYDLSGDYLIDIENKMFTHRPDCFGFLGISRELAGIQRMQFKSPAWYTVQPQFPGIETEELPLSVQNELPELAPRFTAITMSNVEVGPSPMWLQVELTKVGLRPINNIVDYTNFFMLETGQPLHAYDYDKVAVLSGDQASLVIRKPHAGEKLTLLNGKVIEPHENAIMIASDKQLIGMGGVMGGSETEVSETTRNIILECANFDMYTIRKTAMEHGIFTDAVTRFNKGQSPLQNLAVLVKIVDEIRNFAGGKVASRVIDDNHLPSEMLERGSVFPSISVSSGFINARLGLGLSATEISQLLGNVEFNVTLEGDNLIVTAPFWRTDIEIPEDIVEEVGRLYGYDKLPLVLPRRDILPVSKNPLLVVKQSLRESLAKTGANEVLTYSFIHGNLINKVGQDREQAYRLSNALSPDLQYYRMSITPSLLDKVHPNIKAGYREFAIFELGKVHVKSENDPAEPDVPKEANALGAVIAADDKTAARDGAAFYTAKRYLLALLQEFQLDHALAFEPLAGADLYENPWLQQMAAPFEPAHSAVLRDQEKMVWGIVGEYKDAVKTALKLPEYTAGFEIDPLVFLLNTSKAKIYVPLPRFPKVQQDITLKVSSDVPFQAVYDLLNKHLKSLEDMRATLQPLDIYQGGNDPGHKHLTFRYTVAHYQKTLTTEEVNTILDQAAAMARNQLRAERI